MSETTQAPPGSFVIAGSADQKAKEAYFTASQTQLIWARFKRQRGAMIAAGVLVFLILTGHFRAVHFALRSDDQGTRQGL